jgi:hypothetical protein
METNGSLFLIFASFSVANTIFDREEEKES